MVLLVMPVLRPSIHRVSRACHSKIAYWRGIRRDVQNVVTKRRSQLTVVRALSS